LAKRAKNFNQIIRDGALVYLVNRIYRKHKRIDKTLDKQTRIYYIGYEKR